MRTRAVSSSPRAHSILLTYRCTSSVREARKPLRDNKHGQTASHLCQEFWYPLSASGGLPIQLVEDTILKSLSDFTDEVRVGTENAGVFTYQREEPGHFSRSRLWCSE